MVSVQVAAEAARCWLTHRDTSPAHVQQVKLDGKSKQTESTTEKPENLQPPPGPAASRVTAAAGNSPSRRAATGSAAAARRLIRGRKQRHSFPHLQRGTREPTDGTTQLQQLCSQLCVAAAATMT